MENEKATPIDGEIVLENKKVVETLINAIKYYKSMLDKHGMIASYMLRMISRQQLYCEIEKHSIDTEIIHNTFNNELAKELFILIVLVGERFSVSEISDILKVKPEIIEEMAKDEEKMYKLNEENIPKYLLEIIENHERKKNDKNDGPHFFVV